jgi:hypothetical protein
MQLPSAHVALEMFTLMIDASKGGERVITDTAPDMYYSSRQVIINRAHERKLKALTLGLVVQ